MATAVKAERTALAAAAVASISVNAWLVRAVAGAVAGPASHPPKEHGRRYTGFAQA